MVPLLEAMRRQDGQVVAHRGHDAAGDEGGRIRGRPRGAIQVADRDVGVGRAPARDRSVVSRVLGSGYGGVDHGPQHEVYGGASVDFLRVFDLRVNMLTELQWTADQACDFIRKTLEVLRDGEQRIYYEV